MKTLTYTIAIGLSVFFLMQCTTPAKTVNKTTPTEAWEPTEKALLWKISKKGRSDSYVFGTIHLINGDHFFWPDGIHDAINNSDNIVYEIDMKEMTDMSAIMGLMDKMMMADGLTLKDLLSDEDYDLVNNHFNKMGLPLVFLERIQPMFLSVFAGGDMDPAALQSGAMKSYEMELNKLAEEAGLTSGGLETIEYQLSVFDNIDYKDQADMLVESIRMTDDSSDMLEIMASMYSSKDIKEMHDYTMSSEAGIGEYDNLLLYDRNRNWIPKIDSITNEGATLFAVGAAHLGGHKGVLALLKSHGYTLTPVDL